MADIDDTLNVEFDKIVFYRGGKCIPGHKPRRWKFDINDHRHSPEMLSIGRHQVRLGFSGQRYSEILELHFVEKFPIPISLPPIDPSYKVIR